MLFHEFNSINLGIIFLSRAHDDVRNLKKETCFDRTNQFNIYIRIRDVIYSFTMCNAY